MNHRKSGRQLNRNSSHRKAMFRNMTGSLVSHEIIKTTLPKAKELRRVIEPLITMARDDANLVKAMSAEGSDTEQMKHRRHALRKLAFSRIRDKKVVTKLFEELGPRFSERQGGYTRIMKCGFRSGDKAPMAYIELLDRDAPSVEE